MGWQMGGISSSVASDRLSCNLPRLIPRVMTLLPHIPLLELYYIPQVRCMGPSITTDAAMQQYWQCYVAGKTVRYT